MSVTLYGESQYLPTGRILENPLGGALYEFKSQFNPNIIYAAGHSQRNNDDALEGLFDIYEAPSWINWWRVPMSTSEMPTDPPGNPPPVLPPPVNPPPKINPEVLVPSDPPGGDIPNPVPEPSMVMLVVGALMLILLFRRFRRAVV